MGKYLKKIQKELNARTNAARDSKEARAAGRGGGGYVDAKHAAGIHKPGSMRLDK